MVVEVGWWWSEGISASLPSEKKTVAVGQLVVDSLGSRPRWVVVEARP